MAHAEAAVPGRLRIAIGGTDAADRKVAPINVFSSDCMCRDAMIGPAAPGAGV